MNILKKKRGKKSKWTQQQDKILYENYYDKGGLYCSEKLGFKRSIIRARANHLGLKVNPQICSHFYNTEDLSHFINIQQPFIAYFLGFLWADGTISRKTSNIRLKIVNEDFQKIKEETFKLSKSWKFRIDNDGNPNHKEQAVLEINHKGLHKFLEENDYLIKSGASADKILSKIPEELQHYWWRGYFDGDGCFINSGHTKRVSIVSCYQQDWTFLDNLCKKLNIGYRIHIQNKGKCKNSAIFFDNEHYVKTFCNYIYGDEQFGLKRKQQKYLDYLNHKQNVRPNKTSKYRGVSFSRNRWIMQIYKGKHYRKQFDSELEAAKEYDKLAKELFGNKAVLNFP